MLREAIRFLGPLRPLAKRSARFFFPRYSWFLDRLNWEARLNATVKEFPSALELGSREDLYRYVSGTLLAGSDKEIDYLEFGVFEGASLRQWCALNRNAASRFFGFDSFEGLPEDWHSGQRRGAFSTGGKLPELADPRVSFVAGWFQQSLRGFMASYRPQKQLVLHVDCDLYSSTLYCLTILDPVIPPGTVLVLDDFFDALHVYRALADYCSAYVRQYKIVARTHELGQAAIVML
ncbi:MAG TPA: class I SAM-dependent methyltransferase [Candidatus Sulfotelmatobacter sp.]|nr:class I SAM-dependent methyltransferase [Candidatus Sulfotelmatobacter sp.]